MNPNSRSAAELHQPAAGGSQSLGGGLSWRAALPGLLAALLGVTLGLAGLLEVAPDARIGTYIALGAGLAGITGMVGARFKVAATRRPSTDPFAANALQAALLGDFVLQVMTVGIGATALHWNGMKFPIVAGFGVAFAAVALVHQAGSSLILARALSARHRTSVAATEPASASLSHPSSNPSTATSSLETDA